MGYISKDFIDKLLDRAHIDEVIGKFVDLKKAGANLSAKSPFSEDRTASLMVSPSKNMWKDFSSGKGGNVVTFVMEVKPCSYPEAIEIIAGIYNEPVEYVKDEWSEKRVEILAKKEVLRKVLNKVHELYFKKYQSLAIDHPAKIEVEGKRQYTPEIIADWGIGFAPDNYLYDLLKNSGKVSEGEALGVIKGQWDKYSNRIVYPIKDINGLLIGFGGRDISGKSNTAKWINPPVDSENLLYNKSKVWYGLDRAKFEIRKRGEVFITEGYNDVIAWHTNGLENTVASCGTAITEQQINEIQKLCTKAVFCMDPDEAGKKAVLKQLPEFIKAGFRTEVISLDADPDDYVRNYKSEITTAGGLEKIFKVPGTRKDGFAVLIDEFIKKDYLQLENELVHHRAILANEIVEFQDEKENLTYASGKIANDFIEAQNLLKEITLKHTKKSEEFTTQNAIVVDLKGKLEKSKNDIKNYAEPIQLKKQRKVVDELTTQYDLAYTNSDLKRSSGAKELCKIIINIQDDSHFEIYLSWIQKESRITKAKLNAWIKELRAEAPQVEEEYNLQYELPKNVKIPFSELEKDIKTYGMFMANNQIFFALPEKVDGKVNFTSMSNFEIEALQHMNDEKFPMKLLRIKNVHNLEKIFDTPSENLNTPQAFDNTVTGHGNFRFDGNRSDLLRLRTWLFDKMGNGRKIDVLGWQPDGKFWCWNNKITTEAGGDVPINEHGIFIIDKTHYYVPSANQIYKNNSFKYDAQKRFKKIDNPTSFAVFALKVKEVHRDHAISALLFGIASIFQDIVVEKLGNFPILFFYGPGSSGKDELAAIVQSFVGVPQIAINLEGNVSTIKAQVREFAQFRNGISQLSEYKRGNPQLDGMLKALWDRRGYKRGNIESHVGTESIPIESSAILTGNDYPNEEPLILRLIWNEMDKNKFSQDEMKAFDELRDMREKGVSCYSNDFFQHRIFIAENFEKEQRSWKGILQELFPEAKSRIISNLSILASVYSMLKDKTNFPFTQEEMIEHFRKGIDQQIRKINSASILNRFWDCFIASLRGNREQRLQVGYIISVSGDELFMQWSHTYNKIQMEWIARYKELAPAKQVIKDQLVQSGQFLRYETAHSFSEGRNANRSSATVINMNALFPDAKTDIIGSVMYQVNEGTLWEKQKEEEKPADPSQPAISFSDNSDFFET